MVIGMGERKEGIKLGKWKCKKTREGKRTGEDERGGEPE